jgi:hypothetical protein
MTRASRKLHIVTAQLINVTDSSRPDPEWSPVAAPPQRYSSNYANYVARGGMVKPIEDASGFAAGGKGDAARFFFFCLVLDQLDKEGLAGDLAELGVYKGYTATLLATISRRLGKTAYLFDTFEGFHPSDLRGIDAGKGDQFRDTSVEAVKALVGEDSVQYVKGFFPESTGQICGDITYCLVHIDCDLYAPALSALQYFYPRMIPGGFIIIHDYSSLGWSGAERAVDEFFADKVESIIPLPDSAGSAIVRKAKTAGAADNWRIRKSRMVFNDTWTSPAHNGLAEVIGAGWSVPETWGVWGVGSSHELALYPPDACRYLILDFDVHVPLIEQQASQEVVVLVNEKEVARWHFSTETNRGVRTIVVNPDRATNGNLGLLRVEFRPRSLVKPNQFNPSNTDSRDLGMALHRLRFAAWNSRPPDVSKNWSPPIVAGGPLYTGQQSGQSSI